MRSTLVLAILLFLPASARSEEWRTLFNGKDLTGWKANNDADSFKVVDGTIRVQSSASTSAHLFVVGEKSASSRSSRTSS